MAVRADLNAATDAAPDPAPLAPPPPPTASWSWPDAAAGGAAGLCSRLATAPLDLLRIRRQLAGELPGEVRYGPPPPRDESVSAAFRRIAAAEGGLPALFRGNVAAIYLWVGYAAVQFAGYGAARRWLGRHWHLTPDGAEAHPSLAAFAAGAAAGAAATAVTYPFDVCRTAFAARGRADATAVARPTAAPATAPAHVPFSSLVDPCYRPATTASPPATQSPAPPTGLAHFAAELYRRGGARAFYAGAGPALVQIVPYMGLNFTIYEYLTARGDDGAASPLHRRLLGSAGAGIVSGAVSKVLVYPLDTVKRRLQGQALRAVFWGDRAVVATGGAPPPPPYRGMWDCARTLRRREGCRAFYRGLVPAVYKSAAASALSFAVFHWTRTALQALVVGDDP